MTPEELSFEAYVVYGNALNVLLNGISDLDRQRLGLPLEQLHQLYQTIEPAQPDSMLRVIEDLPQAERQLLSDAVRLCERIAGSETDTLLGSSAEARAQLLDHLRNPLG